MTPVIPLPPSGTGRQTGSPTLLKYAPGHLPGAARNARIVQRPKGEDFQHPQARPLQKINLLFFLIPLLLTFYTRESVLIILQNVYRKEWHVENKEKKFINKDGGTVEL
jgi:hypothetical protein